MVEKPYSELKDDERRRLVKNNEAKIGTKKNKCANFRIMFLIIVNK